MKLSRNSAGLEEIVSRPVQMNPSPDPFIDSSLDVSNRTKAQK